MIFKKFGDLELGTVFKFADGGNSRYFWIVVRSENIDIETPIKMAVRLFGNFEIIRVPYDSKVIVVDTELQILK